MERNKSLDGLKYVLIVLVILGHFIEPSRYTTPFSSALYSVIFSFHMPLFILLSGYFYKHRSFSEELKKCLPLIETCLIAQICFSLIRDGGINRITILDVGQTPAWYLFSLVIWRLVSSVLLDYFKKDHFFVASIVAAVVFFLAMPPRDLCAAMRTFLYFPYFLAGSLLQGQLQILKKYRLPILLVGAAALVFILLNVSRFQHVVFFQKTGFAMLAEEFDMNTANIIFYVLNLCCMPAMSLAILTMSFDNKFMHYFASYGQRTLFIYFGQTILHIIVILYGPGFEMALLLTLIAAIGLTIISAYKFSEYLMHPVYTLFLKKRMR